MSVRLENETIRLEGRCHVEDAEPLLALLQADGTRTVDLAASEALHTAVVQVLLAFRPQLAGDSGDAFVRDWVVPALTGVASA